MDEDNEIYDLNFWKSVWNIVWIDYKSAINFSEVKLYFLYFPTFSLK